MNTNSSQILIHTYCIASTNLLPVLCCFFIARHSRFQSWYQIISTLYFLTSNQYLPTHIVRTNAYGKHEIFLSSLHRHNMTGPRFDRNISCINSSSASRDKSRPFFSVFLTTTMEGETPKRWRHSMLDGRSRKPTCCDSPCTLYTFTRAFCYPSRTRESSWKMNSDNNDSSVSIYFSVTSSDLVSSRHPSFIIQDPHLEEIWR